MKKILLNDYKILLYFRNVMLTIYFLNLIPIFYFIHVIISKYDLDIVISIIVFLIYVCIHLVFYTKYRGYFEFDDL